MYIIIFHPGDVHVFFIVFSVFMQGFLLDKTSKKNTIDLMGDSSMANQWLSMKNSHHFMGTSLGDSRVVLGHDFVISSTMGAARSTFVDKAMDVKLIKPQK